MDPIFCKLYFPNTLFPVLLSSILDIDKESSHMSHLEETGRVMEVVGQFFTQ